MIFRVLQDIGETPALLPIVLLTWVGGIIIAFTLHELAHAVTAKALGDDTAEREGRITLNPLAHVDPAGLLLLLLAGFGWAKPVPFNPYRLKVNQRLGIALIAAAGPATNLLLALLYSLPMRLGLITDGPGNVFAYSNPEGLIFYFLNINLYLNLVLMVFNLLPVAPLDGWKILLSIAPKDLANTLFRYEQYGMVILFGLFASSYFLGFSILGRVMDPVVANTYRLLVGI